MDSRISLALAEKLRRIFEKDDTFLTYPLGIGFPNRALSFMKELQASGLDAAQQLRDKCDFARLHNIVPHDSALFSGDASQPLWDRSMKILNDAVFAQSGLSEAEEKRLAEAIDFLTDLQQVGTAQIAINSAAVTQYYTYKTAYDNAEQTYIDEKMTVESTTGPEGEALRQRWHNSRDKQLKELVQRALEDLNNLGSAVQVRAAQAIRAELEPKKYLDLYRAAYESEISIAEIPDLDANGLGIYSTFFSPFNIFDPETSWNQLTLTRTELDTLADSAAPELKALFGGTAASPIEAVTLEYTNVAIVRPWFRPEFFAARTWKFADSSVVSDGGRPCTGIIPAYVTSMLVTRNITVTRFGGGASQAPLNIPILVANRPIDHNTKGNMLKNIGAKELDRTVLEGVYSKNQSPPIKFIDTSAVAFLRQPQVRTAARAPAAAPALRKQPTAVALGSSTESAIRDLAFRDQLARGSITDTVRDTTFTRMMARDPTVNLDIQRIRYVGEVIAAVSPPPPPPPALPPTATTERYAFDGVIVLAYVCKRVPLSPNPDPKLKF
jgi:hypothetical protein